MDDYSDGFRPPSSTHKKDPRSLVNNRPEIGGGNERPGYPKGISQNPENSDDPQWSKIHGQIPGEAVLMDDRENDLGEPGDSPYGLGNSFVAPEDMPSNKDKRFDNIDVGPHNMQTGNVFNRLKDRVKIKGVRI